MSLGSQILLGATGWFAVAVFYFFLSQGEEEPHEYVWWPITFTKFLLKSLWMSLSTGWRGQ